MRRRGRDEGARGDDLLRMKVWNPGGARNVVVVIVVVFFSVVESASSVVGVVVLTWDLLMMHQRRRRVILLVEVVSMDVVLVDVVASEAVAVVPPEGSVEGLWRGPRGSHDQGIGGGVTESRVDLVIANLL